MTFFAPYFLLKTTKKITKVGFLRPQDLPIGQNAEKNEAKKLAATVLPETRQDRAEKFSKVSKKIAKLIIFI